LGQFHCSSNVFPFSFIPPPPCPQFYVVAEFVICQQEYLAKFGYRPDMKAKEFKKPFTFLATFWKLLQKSLLQKCSNFSFYKIQNLVN